MNRVDVRCNGCPLQVPCSLEPERPPCAAQAQSPATNTVRDAIAWLRNEYDSDTWVGHYRSLIESFIEKYEA